MSPKFEENLDVKTFVLSGIPSAEELKTQLSYFIATNFAILTKKISYNRGSALKWLQALFVP